MNELKSFENPDFGQVRSVEINGEAWLLGSDVATALGYTNPAKAIRDHVYDEDKLTERFVLSGQNREAIVINESGVYALIFGSKLPTAKKFKHWVTSEVLPAIRKTGCYTEPVKVPKLPRRSTLELQSLEDGDTIELRIMKMVGDYADIETLIGFAIVDMAVKRGLYTTDLAVSCLRKGMEAYVHAR